MNVENRPLNAGAAFLALLTAALWGGNSVSIKLALAGIPPLWLAGLRFVLGGAVVLVYARISRISLRLHPGELRPLCLLVCLFMAQIYLLNVGTEHTLGGRSTLFISTYPFFTALFAHLFIPGDPLSRGRVLGMALSFAGVAAMLSESLLTDASDTLLGDALVLASGLLLGGRQVFTKRLTQEIDPARLLAWQAGLSVPVFFGLGVFLEGDRPWHLTPAVLAGVFYQGAVVAGVCFLIMVGLLKRHRASRVGVFGFVTPLFGVLLSQTLLGEPITPSLVASVLLVGAGIAVVNRSQ